MITSSRARGAPASVTLCFTLCLVVVGLLLCALLLLLLNRTS